MKKRFQECRVILLLCLALGWWGFWYPELEQAADTYALVLEDGTVQKSSQMIKYEFDDKEVPHWRNMERNQIRVNSKLWKILKEFLVEDRM